MTLKMGKIEDYGRKLKDTVKEWEWRRRNKWRSKLEKYLRYEIKGQITGYDYNTMIKWEQCDRIWSLDSDKVRWPNVKATRACQGDVPEGKYGLHDQQLVESWNSILLS